ncbi:hypothetical protein JFL43_14735 [Viridibacillus sp. YIM B01967]|uniref:Uncharacterized protein n=1 Tax=Viridibacillus soli TaxID=2798301 RepID=A0ABS1H9L0_9BACL|nr:hypothetical protein [Viridibacillus soli]MBK3496096.1 hypothetical protein [Viridibacillus soli]
MHSQFNDDGITLAEGKRLITLNIESSGIKNKKQALSDLEKSYQSVYRELVGYKEEVLEVAPDKL